MTQTKNGRLNELQLIASHGATIVSPNRWVSSAIVKDFIDRGLIQRSGTQATVTEKGLKLLNESTAKRAG